MWYITLLVLSLIGFQSLCSGDEFKSVRLKREDNVCTTPNGDPGNCIPVKECKEIFDLLVSKKRDPQVQQFVRRSQCDGIYITSKVCCRQNFDENLSSDNETIFDPNLFVPNSCGKSEESAELSDGGVARPKAWPWLTFLMKTDVENKRELFCGGVLITKRHVLTAATCVGPNVIPKHVRLVEFMTNATVNPDGTHPEDIEIKKIIIHPKHKQDFKNVLHNIAIVVLKDPVAFTAGVQPICLPIPSDVRFKNLTRTSAHTLSWGYEQFANLQLSSKMLEFTVPVTDLESCKVLVPIHDSILFDDRVICTRTPDNSICGKSTGFPLVAKEGDQMYVIGIDAFVFDPCRYFSGHTQVSQYLGWIAANTF